jgi:hypothetical protein
LKIIVGFSFGRRGDWPNLSSQAIAHLIAERVSGMRYDYVVIAQWEVARALEMLSVQCEYVVWSRNFAQGYLRTTDVASQASRYAYDNQLLHSEEVYAAAHPHHVARCIAAMNETWLTDATPLTDPNMPYDPDSSEFWVRGRRRYVAWDRTVSAVSRLSPSLLR